MPSYVVQGTNTRTGRKKKLIISAKFEAEARLKADEAGMIEYSIGQQAEPPATERQIAYATSLGLLIPEMPTLEQLSDLISSKVDNDRRAEPRHRAFAQYFEIEITDFIGKKALFNRIKATLGEPGRERELVAWFTFRISRSIFKGRPDAPIDSPAHPIIVGIADELHENQALLKSIRRYTGESLIWFGEFKAPDGIVFTGASCATIAYDECNSRLTKALGIKDSKSFAKPVTAMNAPKSEIIKPTKVGCLPVFLIGFGFSFFAFSAFLYLANTMTS